ncbi:glycosyltransferase [Micromonospora olivasterospora]|uniref:Glycosyltransferase involved in cell wall biosynthesis n=1 Tax=Micromonospora olivasterospora TaxID=1880 RepID=A0A562ICI0_MICOL|nr:glycosyltransferase [Micromonospora olivasterospora]TWH68690.1 glycosyltransferase involved in cell wall biosynthesis [Micromonospora olivasterospora]
MTTPLSPAGSTAGADSSQPTILVLGTAEWNSQIATNQHYVVRELARDFDTYFVESLGLRRVRLDSKDVSRLAKRLRHAVVGHEKANAYRPIPERAKVISPLIVPIHQAPTRLPNRLLLERAVAEWRRSPRPRILWTFTPVTYDLEQYADYTLYHCVDILQAFPGIDASAVSVGERNLAHRADLTIGTSGAVTAHLTDAGFTEVLTLPNVADIDVFSAGSRPAAERRPAALFAGNLSPHKLDFALLRTLTTALRGHGELLLAGPIAAGGGGFDRELAELERLGARYLGVLTLDRLAEVAGTCSVGLIPYALNEYTAGVSPLKCYEYLASGLNVVSTAIPDVVQAAARTDQIVAAASADDFVRRVLDTIRPAEDDVAAARVRYAGDYGWSGRGGLLRDIAHRMPRRAHDAVGDGAGEPRG